MNSLSPLSTNVRITASVPPSAMPKTDDEKTDAFDPFAAWRKYLLMREQTLTTELNEVKRLLGKNPKRCQNCGELMK